MVSRVSLVNLLPTLFVYVSKVKVNENNNTVIKNRKDVYDVNV